MYKTLHVQRHRRGHIDGLRAPSCPIVDPASHNASALPVQCDRRATLAPNSPLSRPPPAHINTNKEFGRRSADNSHTQEEEIHCLPVHNVAEVGIVCEMHAYKFPSEAEVFPPTATEGNKPDDAFRDQ